MVLQSFPKLVVLDIFHIELNYCFTMFTAHGTFTGQVKNLLIICLYTVLEVKKHYKLSIQGTRQDK